MNPSQTAWAEANQAFLVREFARLKVRLGIKPEAPPNAVVPPSPALEPPAAIDWVSKIFGLSPFERDILLLCAGVEMDSSLAAFCGEAQGSAQRAGVTFGFALARLPEPHWSALTPVRPLRRFRLLEATGGSGLTTTPWRIDERILHLLAGINLLDTRLAGLVQPASPPVLVAAEHQAVVAEMVHRSGDFPERWPLLHFCGNDPLGQEDVAHLIARHWRQQLFIMRAEDLPISGPEAEQFKIIWQRETLLLPAALLIQCGDTTANAAPIRLAQELPGLVCLTSREPFRLNRPGWRFDVNKPKPAEQKALWEKSLGPAAKKMNGELDALASQFRWSARTIVAAGELLGGKPGKGEPAELWDACCSWSRPRLAGLAQRIAPGAGWDDLVLPDHQKETLHVIASQVCQRMKVYETWGFSARDQRGLGVSALFVGESGTGKTMAAEVLANELKLDLYRIDLSAVVSKYIGETEKNLKQVFDAAEESGAILLFDEADALFGKRSDVKDSHDRYANIEVSYLLQRMEAYQGLAILTTNLKSAIDRAFQRRIRFTVNFPFPDAPQREAIWSRIFPAQTPTHRLDRKRLAQLNVAGGNIRNIALNAAFLAAADATNASVNMSHVFRAARLEAEKIERSLSEAEIRGWV